MEKFGAFMLVVACLFMAFLNLWNLFKEWFDSKYQPRNENKASSSEKVGEQNDGIDKHIYIYKDKLKEKDKGMDVKNEFAAPKQNEPFLSIDMDKKEWLEEETVLLETTSRGKEHPESFDSGTTMDEFELVAKALRGKPIKQEGRSTSRAYYHQDCRDGTFQRVHPANSRCARAGRVYPEPVG
ncbi:hypothetical protein EZS27_023188 [termite gut metagenome]|uniref:Uncharacterized protein n=1 Tax=termite gut metagenome TaxID=433724 RepID=A0A5J4R2S4_9ZZZZ